MSVTVVNDWRFADDADMDEAMDAIRAYMSYLDENDTGLEQSLWLRVRDDTLRYFHIATYRTLEELKTQLQSDGTERFVDRLYPHIDPDSVVRPVGDVVANVGTGPGAV